MPERTPADLADFIATESIAARLISDIGATPTVPAAAAALGVRSEQIVKTLLFLVETPDAPDGVPVVVISNGESRVEKRTSALKQEQEKSERLLLNVLPKAIADRLKHEPRPIANAFDEVTVLFADIVNFSEVSSHVSPRELVQILNQIFSAFDRLSEKYGVEKIKTIGDAYSSRQLH